MRPTPDGDKIAVGREYIEFGQIDLLSARFSTLDGLPPGVKVREALSVAMVSHGAGSPEWRIEGSMPEPLLSVDAAIRFLTDLHSNAKDATIQQNANQTIAVLRRFR
jgi:hypothetical protein